jgi:hypothetical protein
VTADQMAAAQARIDCTTPGEWVDRLRGISMTDRGGQPFDMFVGDEGDVDFICNAREDLTLALAALRRVRALLADSPVGYSLDVRDALDGAESDDECGRCAHIRAKHRSGWCNGDPVHHCFCPEFYAARPT